MKIAILIKNPVGISLTAVAKVIGGHEPVEKPEDADIVLAEEVRPLRQALERGQYAIQFIVDPRDAKSHVARELAATQAFAGRFRAFQVLDGDKDLPGAVELYAYLAELATNKA